MAFVITTFSTDEPMSKKTKFFRVAVQGQTTDGREITRDWITQMAATYSATKYGARINLEHMRGVMPDGPFRAYGDVLAVQAKELDGEFAGKMGLFVQISPTDDLVAMNKNRQKVFTSIEVDPDFAGSGQAYLVGVAVTDNPASLGTEMLQFASKNPAASPFASRKQNANTVFSTAQFSLELDMEPEPEDPVPSFFSKIKDVLSGNKAITDKNFSDIKDAVTALADHSKTQADTVAQQGTDIKALRDELTTLTKQLGSTPNNTPPRPAATGGSGVQLTDC